MKLILNQNFFQTRSIDRTKNSKIAEANFYFLVESGLALAVSFFINMFVMSVFAEGLYHKSSNDIVSLTETCLYLNFTKPNNFNNYYFPERVV